MDDVPRETLCDIVARREDILSRTGRNVLQDVKLCEGLLRDHCGEFKREISVLVRALEEGVPAALLASPDAAPQMVLLARLSRRLQDRHGITEEAARWAVESWAFALGIVACQQAWETSKRGNECKPVSARSSPRSAPSRLDPRNQFPPAALRPFVFASGDSATTARELATLCDRHWDEALEYLYEGDFQRWFRRQDRNDLVREAQRVVRRYQDEDEGLEMFLEAMGLPKPQWQVTPHSLNFGSVAVGEKRTLRLTVMLHGRGYVRIDADASDPWLRVAPREVGLKTGEQGSLDVEADADQTPAVIRGGPAITLEGSNGQQETVPARVRVSSLRTAWVRSRGVFAAVRRPCLMGGAGAMALSLLAQWPGARCCAASLSLPLLVWVGIAAGSAVGSAGSLAAGASAGALASVITAIIGTVAVMTANGDISVESFQAFAVLRIEGFADLATAVAFRVLLAAVLGAVGGVVQIARKRT